MGCYISRDQIITSGDVMIQYLKEYYPGKEVYLVGTPDLEDNFRENGIRLTKEMPDVVVIGFDMTLTYEKLERACTYIRNGAVFLATHLTSTARQKTVLFRTAVPYVRRSPCRQGKNRSMSENHLKRQWTWSWN